MAKQLRALYVFIEDFGSVFNSQMAAKICLKLKCQGI